MGEGNCLGEDIRGMVIQPGQDDRGGGGTTLEESKGTNETASKVEGASLEYLAVRG